MKILELFCGTKNVSKEFEKLGFESTTIDFDPKFNASITADILSLNPHDYLGYDVIWASPPCNAFTVALIGRNWNYDHTPKNDLARQGLAILNKTIEFIEVVKPKYFFIENPMGKMRRMPQMQTFKRNTVTYCQYGERRMKPTDIWHNTNWISRPMCSKGDPCHISAPRGSRTGTQGMKSRVDKAAIPKELAQEIAEHCYDIITIC